MKTIYFIASLLLTSSMFAQSPGESISLFNNENLSTVQVVSSVENYRGKQSLKVTDAGGLSEEKMVKINHLDFKNGVIEIELAGKLAENASETARGFVGIAFRIKDDNSKFECIYLRPTNGRADDQVRRNHSVQYISYPDFPWYKLRQETPEKYESYVDLVPGEWIKVRIEVSGEKAKLFVHGNLQPTLIVNDLKLGGDSHGSVGLWIGPGTEAHFSNLFIKKMD
jgi:hypothetical protein